MAPVPLREDILELRYVLERRFGSIPEDISRKLDEIDQMDVVNRLILVAANIRSLEQFRKELSDSGMNFRITGPTYDPTG